MRSGDAIGQPQRRKTTGPASKRWRPVNPSRCFVWSVPSPCVVFSSMGGGQGDGRPKSQFRRGYWPFNNTTSSLTPAVSEGSSRGSILFIPCIQCAGGDNENTKPSWHHSVFAASTRKISIESSFVNFPYSFLNTFTKQ